MSIDDGEEKEEERKCVENTYTVKREEKRRKKV
jgi:hypothetical protein